MKMRLLVLQICMLFILLGAVGHAGAQCLVWPVPADSWKGEYFTNPTLSGSPRVVRNDGQDFLNFDWGIGSPSSTCIPADNFSVRWTRSVYFNTAGNYSFTATTDDGMRVYVDGVLKLDKWFVQPATTYTFTTYLSAGNHTIMVLYYESGVYSVAKLSWKYAGPCYSTPPDGYWKGEYFNNTTVSGSPVMVRNDGYGYLDFQWGSGSPGCSITPDYFSARWSRSLYVSSPRYYIFTVTVDDGVRIYIDGSLVLDKWIVQAPTTYTIGRVLSAGYHNLQMNYFENLGGATAKLSWTAVYADYYEPDDTGAAAKVIQSGQTQTHSIHLPGDEDWAKFTLTQKSDVRIETNGPAGNDDTMLYLFGPNSSTTLIESDDDDGVGNFSLISRTGAYALNPGTYYLRVKEYYGTKVIPSYTLALTVTGTTPPPPANVIKDPELECIPKGCGTFWSFYTNGTGSFTEDLISAPSNYVGHVRITTTGSNMQLNQANIPLKPNRRYRLSFYGASKLGHDVGLSLAKNVSPYTNYGLSNYRVDLPVGGASGLVRKEIIFTTTGFSTNVTDGRLYFWFPGYATAGDEYWIDKVELVEY